MPHADLILLPRGSVNTHYEDTIETPVPLNRIRQHVDPADPVLRILEQTTGPSGAIPTWGFRPGAGETKWQQIAPGHTIGAFLGSRELFSAGLIVGTSHAPSLAEALWQRDEEGRTWEYIAFFGTVERLQTPLSYPEVAELLGYDVGYNFYQAHVVSGNASAAITERLIGGDRFQWRARSSVAGDTLPRASHGPITRSNAGQPEPRLPRSREDVVAQIEALEGMSRERLIASREEQSLYRELLLGNRTTAHCALCREEFPADLLVAAHIKRRAECTDTERRDYTANVMLACRFGCDELFERGYIIVKNGRIHPGPVVPITDIVRNKVSYLRGKECVHWSPRSAPYFAAHTERHQQLIGEPKPLQV